MPTNPIIPQSDNNENIRDINVPAPINATVFAKDIAKSAAEAFIPNFNQVAGIPSIVDANSLGILIQGAGFGQVKSFIAQAAIKSNEEITRQTNQIQLKSDNPAEMNAGYKTYFETDRSLPVNPNRLLGQYLFDKVSFSNNRFTNYSIDSQGRLQKGVTERIPDLTLNACVVSIDANRYVQQSVPINADAGTIKEIMAFGEYNIKMVGHFVNDSKPKEYAIQAVQSLDKLTKMTTYVNVESLFLNIFGINKVVITDYTLEQVEGFNGILTYTITAISETVPSALDPNLSNFGTSTQFQNPNL